MPSTDAGVNAKIGPGTGRHRHTLQPWNVHLLQHLDGEVLHRETLHARLAPLLPEPRLVEHARAAVLSHLELGDARTLVWSKKAEVSDKGTGLRGLVRARDELGKGGGPPTI